MPFPVPARIEKLPLVTRKSIRDDVESKKGDLQERIAKAIGFDTFEINFDANQVIAYASTSNTAPGNDIFKYFDKFTTTVEEYTKKGEDAEAKSALQKVLAKKTATLAACVEEDGINYCNIRIRESTAFLLFHHSQFGSWQSSVCDDFAREVDKAVDQLSDGDLPVSTKRAITSELEPRLKKASDKFEKMFGQPITLGYNVKEILDFLKKPENRKLCSIGDGELDAAVPRHIGDYFDRAADSMESQNFGKDDMMQEAFIESAEKGIVFEVVDKLQNNQTYNDCLFEDGYFKLQTVPSQFGSWIGDTATNAANRL